MITRLITFVAVFGLFATALLADASGELKSRMDQRLARVDDLKSQQVVGENNRGLLEVRQPAAGADSLVTEENRDREELYALIAKRANTTPELVAKARAKNIAERSKAGIWLQDESGKWYQK